METKLIEQLIEQWQELQARYEKIADENRDNPHNYAKFTYKAVATRDCWKQLNELLNNHNKMK